MEVLRRWSILAPHVRIAYGNLAITRVRRVKVKRNSKNWGVVQTQIKVTAWSQGVENAKKSEAMSNPLDCLCFTAIITTPLYTYNGRVSVGGWLWSRTCQWKGSRRRFFRVADVKVSSTPRYTCMYYYLIITTNSPIFKKIHPRSIIPLYVPLCHNLCQFILF